MSECEAYIAIKGDYFDYLYKNLLFELFKLSYVLHFNSNNNKPTWNELKS